MPWNTADGHPRHDSGHRAVYNIPVDEAMAWFEWSYFGLNAEVMSKMITDARPCLTEMPLS
jgi:hypothetical protein